MQLMRGKKMTELRQNEKVDVEPGGCYPQLATSSSVLEKECARACWGCCEMSRGYVYLELRRTLRYGAPGARIDINIPKNRASCTTRLARSRSRQLHNHHAHF